jgi:hypothetical protein
MLNFTNAIEEETIWDYLRHLLLKGCVCSRDILRKKDIAKLFLCNYEFIISAIGFVYTQRNCAEENMSNY